MEQAVKIGKVTGKIILALLIALLITVVLTGIILIAVMLGEGIVDETELVFELEMNPTLTTVFTIIQSVAFILAAFVVYISFERRKRWPLGWRCSKALIEVVQGMILGIVLIAIVFLIIWLLGGLNIVVFQWNASIFQSLVLAVVLFVPVAISEELFSRGYVQGLIKNEFGTIPAILVSAGLFTLLHAMNPDVFSSPFPVVNLFLAGLLFGISRERSGSLWMPIGLHFTWNLLQGSLFGFPVSGMPVESIIVHDTAGSNVVSGGNFGAEGSIVATVVLLAGTFLIYRFKKSA